MDLDQKLVFVPLLTIELETLAPFWAISDTLAHLTSIPPWEKWVVSNQIYEIWISPFIYDFVIVVSLAFYYLLNINIASHCNIFMSSMPLL